MRSGTHRDSIFCPKSRCFAFKTHRWGLGPLETSISDVNQAVLHVQNDRWSQGPIQAFNAAPKVALLHAKATDESWDQYRLVSLVLKSLFCIEKKKQIMAGTHIDLSFWCKSRCFACTKRQVMSGTHRDLLFPSKSRCFECTKPHVRAGTHRG